MKDLYPDYIKNSQNSVTAFAFGSAQQQYGGANFQKEEVCC